MRVRISNISNREIITRYGTIKAGRYIERVIPNADLAAARAGRDVTGGFIRIDPVAGSVAPVAAPVKAPAPVKVPVESPTSELRPTLLTMHFVPDDDAAPAEVVAAIESAIEDPVSVLIAPAEAHAPKETPVVEAPAEASVAAEETTVKVRRKPGPKPKNKAQDD